MSGNPKSREELTEEAEQVRSKLLRTVGELDDRRHGAIAFRKQLERYARNIAIAGGLLLVVTAGALVLGVNRLTSAADRRRRGRWHLAKSLWSHPERGLRGERRSFFGEIVRSLLLSIASAGVTFPVRHFAAQLERSARAPRRRQSER